MKLADLIRRYRWELEERYGSSLLPEQRRALDAILVCGTPQAGQSFMACPDCGADHWHNHSCGHRSCPQCQNHLSTQWLERQRAKLLPVPYYLVTFTVPEQLRPTAYNHQVIFYEALFTAAIRTIQTVASNPKHLGAEPGITAVLHTQTRRLDFHPHIHLIIPAGGIDTKEKLWKPGKRDYLFPVDVLKKLFREKLLARLRDEELTYSRELHQKNWNVNVRAAGQGEHALEYLSKYLYRGVISENNIISDDHGQVTFAYREGGTNLRKTRQLPAAEFLFLILKHVLPKRFRRTRDYGFLHGNAKAKLRTLQIILHVDIPARPPKPRPSIPCPKCGADMIIVYTLKKRACPTRGSPKKASAA
jgi:hypothetical protein